MTTIACVLRTGGDFSAEDVRRLAEGVQQHMDEPYRFVCLTDDVVAVAWQGTRWARNSSNHLNLEAADLRTDWPGWWAKIEMFRLIDDVVICFDLDTVIVGPLAPLVDAVRRTQGLCMIRSFYQPTCLQSGILAWCGDCRWPLRAFLPAQSGSSGWSFVHNRANPALKVGGRLFRGDGEWLADAATRCGHGATPLQDVVGGLYSYKSDIRDRGLPDDAAVVCFHGRPRPRDVTPRPEWLQRTSWGTTCES